MAVGAATTSVSLPDFCAWASGNGVELRGALEITALSGGRSNESVSVSGRQSGSVVLRRPPQGSTGDGGRQAAREQQVLTALERHGIHVPHSYGLYVDPGAPNSPFHVLGFTEGRVLSTEGDVDPFTPDARQRAANEFVEEVVRLHVIDPVEIGLGGISPTHGLVPRQLARWGAVWTDSGRAEAARAQELADELTRAVPEQAGVSVLHGDLRFSNVVFGRDGSLRALLDWELVTLGDPRLDLGYLLMLWSDPGETPVFADETATRAAGFPRRDDIAAMFRAKGVAVERLAFFHAFACWRLASQLLFLMQRDAASRINEPEDHSRAIDLLLRRASLLMAEDRHA